MPRQSRVLGPTWLLVLGQEHMHQRLNALAKPRLPRAHLHRLGSPSTPRNSDARASPSRSASLVRPSSPASSSFSMSGRSRKDSKPKWERNAGVVT